MQFKIKAQLVQKQNNPRVLLCKNVLALTRNKAKFNKETNCLDHVLKYVIC